MKKTSVSKTAANCIPNGTFAGGKLGGLPEGWTFEYSRPAQAPVFKLVKKSGKKVLLAAGNGTDDCIGYVRVPVSLRNGRTYRMRARFQMSKGLDPQKNLLFCFYSPGFNDGIFRYKKLAGSMVQGEGRFKVTDKKAGAGNARIYFRLTAHEKAWIHSISIEECEPIAPRPVRIACTDGSTDLKAWAHVLDAAGKAGTDLMLLPESMNGPARESLTGPSAKLMARKAKQYNMYVAGGIYYENRKADRVYNATLLFDRKGKRIGHYFKNHPYSPELNELAVTPGTEVPVFKTDFGTIGVIICYDSWFTDVTELLALKGAEIVLFPNAGYFRSLMPARAADNCTRMVVSSLGTGHGIWDTSGTEITRPKADLSCCPNHPRTYSKVRRKRVKKIDILMATLDLSGSPSPHNWGGPMMSAPGGRRNRRDQKRLLYDEIKAEVERWWES